MSNETVSQFLNAVKSDSSLQASLKGSSSVDDVISQASKAGYAITSGDLEAYGKAHAANAEMSDEQLENVAGGAEFNVTYTVLCGGQFTWTAVCEVKG